MFDGGNPDFGFGIQCLREMVHHRIVRLGSAARPDDVIRMAAEKMRELFARVTQRDTGLCADLMRAGRVAGKMLRRIQPCLARLAHDGRCGVVIKINHRSDKILFAAKLASFLWALEKASAESCAGFSQIPFCFAGNLFKRT